MKRNLILIASAILLSIGSWVYADNVKSVKAAQEEAKKAECAKTADGASCCEQKK